MPFLKLRKEKIENELLGMVLDIALLEEVNLISKSAYQTICQDSFNKLFICLYGVK